MTVLVASIQSRQLHYNTATDAPRFVVRGIVARDCIASFIAHARTVVTLRCVTRQRVWSIQQNQCFI